MDFSEIFSSQTRIKQKITKHKTQQMMEDNTITTIFPTNWKRNNSLIKVIGVGGGGNNAVSQMFSDGIEDVEFLVCNTDSQALIDSPVIEKLQLGQGLGAGCDPEKAKNDAIEAEEKIKELLSEGTQMIFITAGMGGGTGTGAAPIIAKIAKDLKILTIAVVTLPFRDEGLEFLRRAHEGIQELSQYVDSLLVIDNQKLYEIYGDLSIIDAFKKADSILSTAVKGIAEIITKKGYINVDFADVRMVMKKSGMALMGIGEGSGEDRVVQAVEQAFTSPLLNDYDLKTAKSALINITSSKDQKNCLKMSELEKIMDYVKEYTGSAFNFKRGVVYDDTITDSTIRITIVATGFRMHLAPAPKESYIDDEDTIKIVVSEKNEESDLQVINIPIQVPTTSIDVSPIDLSQIPTYKFGESNTEMENEPAIERIKRIQKQKIEQQ